MGELPPNWQVRECKDYPGRVYYYNTVDDVSTWIRPVPFSESIKTEWPPLVYVSHILIRHSKSANFPEKRKIEEAKKLINEIYEKITKGEISFKEAAKQYSDCASKENDGVLGWIDRERVSPEFAEAAWKTRINGISAPFETAEGFHIIFRSG